MRIALVLLFLAAAGLGEEASKEDPGRIPTDMVSVGALTIRAQPGDAQLALKTWLEAHALHKANNLPEALAQYLLFLGMPGQRALPARYAVRARERVEAIHDPIRKEFEASLKLYPTQRAKALDIWRLLAARWSELPEGLAARKLWHTDEQRGAIDEAKQLKAEGKAAQAAAALEKAIQAYARGLYLYEARTLLVELGGPDLRPKPKIDVAGEGSPEDDAEDDGKDGGESEIEVEDG